jgi:hypothetical protein
MLGLKVAGCGDVNADGRPDFAVGAPFARSSRGFAYFYSGRNGQLLYRLVPGDPEAKSFGDAIAGAGDLNGDGHADFIVGAPSKILPTVRPGVAMAFSGMDGSRLFVLEALASDEWFGASVAGIADATGDGIPDLLVGAWLNAGSVALFSGADGSRIWTEAGPPSGHFGFSVAGAGDLNGDGWPEFLVAGRGTAVLYSTRASPSSGRKTRPVRTTIQKEWSVTLPGNGFTAVATAGDVNRDGVPDLLIGDAGNGFAGSALLFSGARKRLLYRFAGLSIGDTLGASVCAAGDVNSDGLPDILVGAPENDISGWNAGAAYVFSGGPLFLRADRDTVAPGTQLTLTTAGAVPGSPAAVFITEIGGNPVFQRVPVAGVVGSQGEWQLSGTIQSSPTASDVIFQAFVSDVSSGQLITSNRETVHF